MRAKIHVLVIGLVLLFTIDSNAQYFGRNKPNYETFEFEVYQTPHFEIYHYLKNPELLAQLADLAGAVQRVIDTVLVLVFSEGPGFHG